jgi:hypothetical protein
MTLQMRVGRVDTENISTARQQPVKSFYTNQNMFLDNIRATLTSDVQTPPSNLSLLGYAIPCSNYPWNSIAYARCS